MANSTNPAYKESSAGWITQPYSIARTGIGTSTITVTTSPNASMSNTEKDPELSAEEKLVVAALKGSKTPEQITTLIALARITNMKPSDVLDELSEVSSLVAAEVVASTTVASF